MPAETARFLYELGIPVAIGYGQTEALPITMMGPKEWFSEVEGSNPLRSTGRPLPFGDIEIADPETAEALRTGLLALLED